MSANGSLRGPVISAEQRLRQLGIQLPPKPTPFGAHVVAVQTGNVPFLSGMLPAVGREPRVVGSLGEDVDLGSARNAARIAALKGSRSRIEEKDMLAGIKALTFDTGGTILDWHTGLCQAFAHAGAQHGLSADWPEITNEYRRRSLKMMVSAVNPSFNIEDVHRRMLDAVIEDFKLTALTAEDRESIWRKWHALDTWLDVPAALTRLKTKYVVVSFTILSTSLVIDVSRRNGLTWDCIVSCEMIGTYKTQPQAYRTCAQWLGYRPANFSWWHATIST